MFRTNRSNLVLVAMTVVAAFTSVSSYADDGDNTNLDQRPMALDPVAQSSGTGTLSLETPDCVGDLGDQVTIELWMRDLSQNATGFQAFLEYDTGILAYNGSASTYAAAPFPLHIQSISTAEIMPGQINLDASDDYNGTGTSMDSLLATLIFDVVAECGPTSVDFRFVDHFESEISLDGVPFATTLSATGDFTTDNTPPDITTGSIELCYPTPAAAEADAVAATAATDNCPGALTYTPSTVGDCSATVTVEVADGCGNADDVAYQTRIDNTPPVTTCGSGGGLIISEVLDGTLFGGVPKFIEITNCSDSPVDLSEHRIAVFFNGSLTEDSVSMEYGDMTGVLIPGESFVIAHTTSGPSQSFLSVYGFEADKYDAVANSNGDDVYQLMRDDGAGGDIVVDAHGELGVDGTGTAWDFLDSYAYSAPGRAANGGAFAIDGWVHPGPNVLDGATEPQIAAATSPGRHHCGGVEDAVIDGNCQAVVAFSAVIEDNCCVEPAGVMVTVMTSGNAMQAGAPSLTLIPVDENRVLVVGEVAVEEFTGFPATVTVLVDADDCCGNAAAQCSDDGEITAGSTYDDCNTNGLPDQCDLSTGMSYDCNSNGSLDECDIAAGTDADCNSNGIPDECDLSGGTSADCNSTGFLDDCEIASGSSPDCNTNAIPDECDLAGMTSEDCQPNGIPDECDIAAGGGGFVLQGGMAGGGGIVFLSGDDADDADGHCQGAACGGLYPAVLSFSVNNSASPGTGILAIGVNGFDALSALNGWNSPGNGGPGAAITFVNHVPDIAAVDFADYAVLYIPGAVSNTPGGINQSQLAALNARQADVVDFINIYGGALIALTEQGMSNAYGWLPLPITTAGMLVSQVCPTPALTDAIAPSATCANISHEYYHNIFTGPPGFLGLQVLAVTNQAPFGEAIMLGGVGVSIGGEITLTPNAVENTVGSEHTVTATVVRDSAPFDPLANVEVTFDVISGPNAGDTGTDMTDTNGEATFTYTGDGGEGIDEIQAWFNDGGVIEYSNIVTKIWVSGASQDCNSNGIPDECEAVMPGDFNGDGFIDLGDLEGFVSCIAGPDVLPIQGQPACITLCLEAFDFDGDDDVDLQDFAAWVLVFSP